MAIKITAKKQGFRRAGLAHYDTVVYPSDSFSPEQLKALRSEKHLAVEDVSDDLLPGKAGQDDGAQEPAALGGGSGAESQKVKPAK
jgi:hypothetical protein